MSIPTFPKFETISPKHKETIDKVYKVFAPYCDFNFQNIYNWSDSKTPSAVSLLNDNLVVKMVDFTSEKEILTFIGKNQLLPTVLQLLERSEELKVVPEECITPELTDSGLFEIVEDDGNHDYILSVEKLAKLRGRELKSKRGRVNKFKRLFPHIIVKNMDLTKNKTQDGILQVVKQWASNKKLNLNEFIRELGAINRLVETASLYNMLNVGLYDHGKLIGFTTNELVSKDYALGGFGKADTSYHGIYAYLEHATCVRLHRKRIKYLNYEQDLSIEGLRNSKRLWRPDSFLKKYRIKFKSA